MKKIQILLLPTMLLACGGDGHAAVNSMVEIRCYSGGTLVYEEKEAYDLTTYSSIMKWKEPGGIQIRTSADCIVKGSP